MPFTAMAHGQTTLYIFQGDSAGDRFGGSVSGAGDVNGDGFADLIVGARWDDNNGSNSGSARVFSGVDGSVLFTFNGDSAGDYFGSSVSGAGDVNGD
ncbi:MAG: FG-GAP repeat protein, partial [Planctomycetota bacterium]